MYFGWIPRYSEICEAVPAPNTPSIREIGMPGLFADVLDRLNVEAHRRLRLLWVADEVRFGGADNGRGL